MALSVKEDTAVDRLRNKFAKNTQSSIADGIGVSQQQLSNWKRVMKAISVDVPDNKLTTRSRSTRATAKTVIAAKATRKRTNGLHAH
jgi:hypothetical protein